MGFGGPGVLPLKHCIYKCAPFYNDDRVSLESDRSLILGRKYKPVFLFSKTETPLRCLMLMLMSPPTMSTFSKRTGLCR